MSHHINQAPRSLAQEVQDLVVKQRTRHIHCALAHTHASFCHCHGYVPSYEILPTKKDTINTPVVGVKKDTVVIDKPVAGTKKTEVTVPTMTVKKH